MAGKRNSGKVQDMNIAQLKIFVNRMGNAIVEITDFIVLFLVEDSLDKLHALSELKNPSYDIEKLREFIKEDYENLSDRAIVCVFELYPAVFDDRIKSLSLKIIQDLQQDSLPFNVLCCGRTKKFYCLLEKIVSISTPTRQDFINAAMSNKRTLDLLLIYNKSFISESLFSEIISNEKTLTESILPLLNRLNSVSDPDSVICALLERFDSNLIRIDDVTRDIIDDLLVKSRFEKTIKFIADNDLHYIFESLKGKGIVTMPLSEMMTMFCKKRAIDCLRVASKEHNAMLTHEDILLCLDSISILKVAVNSRALKDPEKLLDMDLDPSIFEFVRSVYREIDSSKISNKRHLVSIKLAENIKSGSCFSDLEEYILPQEFSQEVDSVYDQISDSMSVEIPKVLSFLEYLAILKHYRKYLNAYDVEVVLRKEDIMNQIKKDSPDLIDLMKFEKKYYETVSD